LIFFSTARSEIAAIESVNALATPTSLPSHAVIVGLYYPSSA
jgi:hypothetical protein